MTVWQRREETDLSGKWDWLGFSNDFFLFNNWFDHKSLQKCEKLFFFVVSLSLWKPKCVVCQSYKNKYPTIISGANTEY